MTTDSDSDKKKPSLNLWLYIAPNLLVVILWGLSWWAVGSSSLLSNWPDRAYFGDMFGAVNALFSGLAFAWIIITVYLQSKELAL